MTATTATRTRRAGPWLAIAAVAVLAALIAGAPSEPGSGRPFDPRSNREDGTRALVLLLESLGADVSIDRGAPPDSADVALILTDRLDDDDRAGTRRWVEGGGVLIVADVLSPLAPPLTGTACPEALDDVNEIEIFAGTVLARTSALGCFDDFVQVAEPAGTGIAVGLGAAAPFTNALLDERDNAVLAAALLAPTGRERVVIIDGRRGNADQTLPGLIAPPVRQAIAQLAVAFVLYVLWRGRRLGRPVGEPQPVAVAGSELVSAIGRLLDARGRPDEAAAALRLDLRRALVNRLGLPATADGRTIGAAVAARTDLDADRVAAAIESRPVADTAALVEVAAELDRIRRAAIG